MALFRKKAKTMVAFADGKSVAIEQVPDEVFATKMMGDGIAIQPENGNLYAPCDGEVVMIMEHSLHALGILNEDGMEVLLHVGLDSVNLNGDGFQVMVKKHDRVHCGDLLLRFDQAKFKEHEIDDICMLVLVDSNNHAITKRNVDEMMIHQSSILFEYK